MSFLSENVIPGNYGKKFTTDANEPNEINEILDTLMSLDGVKEVIFEEGSNPTTFVIYTHSIVKVDDITDKVKELNLHAVPTGPFFPLA